MRDPAHRAAHTVLQRQEDDNRLLPDILSQDPPSFANNPSRRVPFEQLRAALLLSPPRLVPFHPGSDPFATLPATRRTCPSRHKPPPDKSVCAQSSNPCLPIF